MPLFHSDSAAVVEIIGTKSVIIAPFWSNTEAVIVALSPTPIRKRFDCHVSLNPLITLLRLTDVGIGNSLTRMPSKRVTYSLFVGAVMVILKYLPQNRRRDIV